MRIVPEVCREIILSKYIIHKSDSNSFYWKFITDKIKSNIIEKIQIEDEFIRIYLAEGSNHIFWTIEYKEYCEFVNYKRQKKLERILNEI